MRNIGAGVEVLRNMAQHALQVSLADSQRLQRRLEELPKGSLRQRIVGKNILWYLVWREGDRVKSRRIPDDQVSRIQQQIAARKEIQRQQREIGKDIAVARRAVYGFRRAKKSV